MPFLELFDETLDINSTENYELSVQVSPDGFSFSLLDTIRNKFVLLRSFEPEDNRYFNADKINELMSKDDFLGKKYKKVNLIMPSRKSTIVPSTLFDPGKKTDYFNFNHTNEEGNLIIVNKLVEPDAFLVFALSQPLTDLMSVTYPGVHPFHHLKPLLHQISIIRRSTGDSYIHIHVERDFFNLIVFSNGIMKFCNSFNYRNISDILYYVLNVFKKLGLRQEETIYFSGLTEKYDDLNSSFSLYVRHIKFSDPTGNFTFSYVFNDIELHRYLNLFSVVNCE